MCRPRVSAGIIAALLIAATGVAAADSQHADAPIPASELPERWRTGAQPGDDLSGDLRPEAIAIEDAAGRAADDGRVLTLADAIGGTAALEPPATVKVWRRGLDGSASSCAGRVDTVPLEKYVKGVLPHEWIRSWQAASLQAGAIAIRTYAAYWVRSGGKC